MGYSQTTINSVESRVFKKDVDKKSYSEKYIKFLYLIDDNSLIVSLKSDVKRRIF